MERPDLTIRTNNVPRDPLYWWDLTTTEQAEFDWLDTDDKQSEASFVRYRGVVYCLSEFMGCRNACGLENWDGYHGDSYFSGVLLRYVDHGERVIMATYFS